MSISIIIWSNISRQQYLQGLTDKQLCEILGVTSRTLYNYRQDLSALIMKKVQLVLDKMSVDTEAMLLS